MDLCSEQSEHVGVCGVYLYGVIFDVEVARSPAQVCGGEVAGALVEADHPGLIQLPARLHHQILPVQLQSWIHLSPAARERRQ